MSMTTITAIAPASNIRLPQLRVFITNVIFSNGLVTHIARIPVLEDVVPFFLRLAG